MSIEDDLIIEQFINGALSPDAEKEFLARMENDSEFREKVLIEKQLFEVFNDDQWNFIENIKSDELKEYKKILLSDETSELKKTLNQVSDSYKNSGKTNKKQWFFYSSIAAMIAILFTVYVNIKPANSIEDLYVDYLKSSELPSLVSRSSDNEQLAKAEEFYANKQYDQALEIYNGLIETAPNNKATLYLYQGVSQMQLSKFQEAEKTFNNLITGPSIDASKGYWYKALLYLKMNNIDKASALLEDIIANKSFNYDKAKKLLKELNRVKEKN